MLAFSPTLKVGVLQSVLSARYAKTDLVAAVGLFNLLTFSNTFQNLSILPINILTIEYSHVSPLLALCADVLLQVIYLSSHFVYSTSETVIIEFSICCKS